MEDLVKPGMHAHMETVSWNGAVAVLFDKHPAVLHHSTQSACLLAGSLDPCRYLSEAPMDPRLSHSHSIILPRIIPISLIIIKNNDNNLVELDFEIETTTTVSPKRRKNKLLLLRGERINFCKSYRRKRTQFLISSQNKKLNDAC